MHRYLNLLLHDAADRPMLIVVKGPSSQLFQILSIRQGSGKAKGLARQRGSRPRPLSLNQTLVKVSDNSKLTTPD